MKTRIEEQNSETMMAVERERESSSLRDKKAFLDLHCKRINSIGNIRTCETYMLFGI